MYGCNYPLVLPVRISKFFIKAQSQLWNSQTSGTVTRMSILAQWAVIVGCESSTSKFRLGTYFWDRDEFQCSWYVQACSASLCSPVALETPVSKFRCSKEQPVCMAPPAVIFAIAQAAFHALQYSSSEHPHCPSRETILEQPTITEQQHPMHSGCGRKCRHKQNVVNHLFETEKYSCEFIVLPHFRSEARVNLCQLASKQ